MSGGRRRREACSRLCLACPRHSPTWTTAPGAPRVHAPSICPSSPCAMVAERVARRCGATHALQVVLDIHEYSYMARNAFLAYTSRLSTVVFEVGFVIQGNGEEELPEQLLGAGRIYRANFDNPMQLA
eukprot:355625-Chlamydomonas_euryale.AAC.2